MVQYFSILFYARYKISSSLVRTLTQVASRLKVEMEDKEVEEEMVVEGKRGRTTTTTEQQELKTRTRKLVVRCQYLIPSVRTLTVVLPSGGTGVLALYNCLPGIQ